MAHATFGKYMDRFLGIALLSAIDRDHDAGMDFACKQITEPGK